MNNLLQIPDELQKKLFKQCPSLKDLLPLKKEEIRENLMLIVKELLEIITINEEKISSLETERNSLAHAIYVSQLEKDRQEKMEIAFGEREEKWIGYIDFRSKYYYDHPITLVKD